MAAFVSQNVPVAGKPGGAASRFLGVDFTETGFDSLLETKCGRFAWARATECPCLGTRNDQTLQHDPSCPDCNGNGFRFFRPPAYVVRANELGTFDAEQTAVINKANAVVIRGLLTSAASDPDLFNALGTIAFGSASLTVRGPNRLSYYDRLIGLDEAMTLSEVITVSGNAIPLKNSVIGVNFMASRTAVFGEDDVTLTAGVLTWKTGRAPPDGTKVTVHYLCHPRWVVMNFTKLHRSSLVRFKADPSTFQTPDGSLVQHPMEVIVRLEHLVGDPRGA